MVNTAFCREIHPGDQGEDVVAHKRGLSRWNPHVYPWPEDGNFTDFAGPYFFTALLQYKIEHGLATAGEKKLGHALVLGSRTHASMEKAKCKAGPHKGEVLFDTRSVTLALQFCQQYVKTPEQKAREAGVAALLFWLAHAQHTAYSQHRPFEVLVPPLVADEWDCSGCATNGQLAGMFPNPNGNLPRGEGYTGTMIDHGVRVYSLKDLQILDFIFYGSSSGRPGFRPGDPTHVATYVGKINGVESVVSMGSYPMSLRPYNYRTINQFRHYSFK